VSIAVGVGAIFYSWAARIFIRVMQFIFGGRNLMAVLRGAKVVEQSSIQGLGGRSASGRTSMRSASGLVNRTGSGMGGRTGSGRTPSGNPARVAPAPPVQASTTPLPPGVKGAWN
jgi:hypothetical protein